MLLHQSLTAGQGNRLGGGISITGARKSVPALGTNCSDASVPGARVTVSNRETNVVTERTTSADGSFTIINLLPGSYTLTVVRDGFKQVKLPAFKLDVNQTLTQNITLELGSVSDTVTVKENAVDVMVHAIDDAK